MTCQPKNCCSSTAHLLVLAGPNRSRPGSTLRSGQLRPGPRTCKCGSGPPSQRTEPRTCRFSSVWTLVRIGPDRTVDSVSVTRNLVNKTISLGQQAYIDQILAHFGLTNTHPDVTPIEPRADYHFDSPSISPTLLTPTKRTTYHEMIGSLMYCATMT